MTIIDAILAAYASDTVLVGLTPGGLAYEGGKPGTGKPRISYRIESMDDVRGYSTGTVRALKRTYTFLFTVYSDTIPHLTSILGRMCGTDGPFEGATFTLDVPEVSGGSRWLESGSRIFQSERRNEDATLEYVGERLYETIVNNPQM